LTHIKDVTN